MSHQATSWETTLEACLTDLQAGRATLDECLAKYPNHAAELEPLLRVAARLQQAPSPTLRPEARLHIKARLQDRARQLPSRPQHRQSAPALNVLRWAFTVGLTVLILSVVTSGAIRASGSLPGEPLYSVKTINEQFESWFTSAPQRPEMHLKFAQRRLDEIMAMGHLGIVDDLAIIKMESEMRQAIELLPTLPNSHKQQVIQKLLEQSQRQQIVLSSILNYTSPLSQAGLDWGIDTAKRRAEMLASLIE